MIPRRPFVSLAVATALTDLEEAQLLALIESGEILYAYDLAAPKASRRMVRMLTVSLVDFTERRPPSAEAEEQHLVTLSSIFPPAQMITATSLASSWLCGLEHVHALLRSRSLCLAPGSISRRGPGGSPVITRASVLSFLTSRRIL